MEAKEELQELEAKIEEGLKRAYQKMVEFKKQKNTPLIISENGRILEIQPEDIPPTTRAKKS